MCAFVGENYRNSIIIHGMKNVKRKNTEGNFQIHASAALSSVKELCLFLDEQLGGSQSRSGGCSVKYLGVTYIRCNLYCVSIECMTL